MRTVNDGLILDSSEYLTGIKEMTLDDIQSGVFTTAANEAVGGKLVRWNQVAAQLDGSETFTDIVRTIVAPNTYRISGTAAAIRYATIARRTPIIKNHKYYLPPDKHFISGTNYLYLNTQPNFIAGLNGAICEVSTDQSVSIAVRISKGQTIDDIYKADLVDLTVMFGNGNEPTSVNDPRIKWIDEYLEEHPEYNAGETVMCTLDMYNQLYNAWQILNDNTQPSMMAARSIERNENYGIESVNEVDRSGLYEVGDRGADEAAGTGTTAGAAEAGTDRGTEAGTAEKG